MTLKVIDSRLRAVGGKVVLRIKRYAKGSQNIKTQFPGAKADFEDLTASAKPGWAKQHVAGLCSAIAP